MPEMTAGPTVGERLFDEACRSHGLPLPVREFKFHPNRNWKADYAFGRVLVERDGGLFGRGKACPVCKRRRVGAHSSITQMKADREKDREAQILGYMILRFLPEQFDSGEAF